MKLIVSTILLSLSLNLFAEAEAHFNVKRGNHHKKASVVAKVLPEPKKFDVLLQFEVKKKSLVPVPDSLLKGSKTYELPIEFRTEEGYKKLEKNKELTIPK